MIPAAPRKTGLVCLLSLLGAALLPNFLWIVRDRSPWPWDQAWYGEVSVDLWFYLRHLAARDWITVMLTGLYMKPPGIVWLGQAFVPLGPLCGSVETALLCSILLTQAVTLYLIFRIGRAIAPASYAVASLGVCLAAAAPAFTGLSHQYFVEPLQGLAVAWTFLVAARATEWPAARAWLHLAAAVLLGLLAKATTPAYCLAPCLYTLVILLRKPLLEGWRDEWRSRSGRSLTLALAAVTPPAAAWYAFNLKAVWQHVREASSGEIALQYGWRAPLTAKLLTWLRLLYHSFLAPYLGWLLAVALLAAIAARLAPRSQPAAPARVWTLALLSAVQCGLLLLMFAKNDTVDSRYMYAMLAPLAAMLMSLVAPLASRPAWAVMFALCALQFASVHRVALGGAAGAAHQPEWLLPPRQDPDQYREMERIVAIASTLPGRYNIVGVEEPWINSNTAAFFAAKQRLHTGVRSYFTSLGYAEKDAAKAWKRVQDFDIPYYISLDEQSQTTPPNFVNLVSLPVLKRIQDDPHFRQEPFPSRHGVVLFRHQ